MRRPTVLALAVLLAACADRGPAGPAGGTVIIAAAADADALVPALRGTSQGRFASELLFDPLVALGPELNVLGDSGFAPRLARRWRWSGDSLALTFELDPDARWHDGAPVVARDVLAGFNAIRERANNSPLITDVEDVDSVQVTDERTATVHFRQRSLEQLYAASMIVPLPSHLVDTLTGGALRTSAYAQAPVGSGPYRFVAWQPKERLEFRAVDDHFRGRPRLDRIVLSVSPEATTGLAKVFAEEADVWEAVSPTDIAEAMSHPHLRLVRTRGLEYGFLAFNFRDPADTSRPHPLLTEPALRRALTLATDREAIVRAVFDTLGVALHGPFVRRQAFADTSIRPLPFDRAAAAALLDSLGWRAGDDGIRRRGRARLSFTALVPASSRNRDRASILLQEQWRLAGIDLRIDRLENQAFGQTQVAGRFDLVFGGWLTTASARGMRGTWGTRARAGWGRQNYGRYESAAFSDAIAAGLAAPTPDAYVARVREGLRVIVADMPAIWLYEPEIVAAVHRRFTLPAWRPDGWWRTLPEWTVDAAQRLPRDAAPATP